MEYHRLSYYGVSGRYCTSCGAEVSVGGKFCRGCGKPLKSTGMGKPSLSKERYYTGSVDEVQQLIRENKLDDAEKLLIELVNATEDEAHQKNWGVAPWYYWRLAVVYRKKKDTESEIKVLERFANLKHSGARDAKLLARLEKLKSR